MTILLTVSILYIRAPLADDHTQFVTASGNLKYVNPNAPPAPVRKAPSIPVSVLKPLEPQPRAVPARSLPMQNVPTPTPSVADAIGTDAGVATVRHSTPAGVSGRHFSSMVIGRPLICDSWIPRSSRNHRMFLVDLEPDALIPGAPSSTSNRKRSGI